MTVTHTITRYALLTMLLSLTAYVLPLSSARAADHGDAPSLAHDQGADIADFFFFLDPNDQTQAVLIGTFHGFIVPGEAVNFAIFDPAIRYRFEIFNDHVNLPAPDPNAPKDVAQFLKRIKKPSATIDVTFSQRVAIVDPVHPDKINLQIPQPQNATLKFTGFAGMTNKGVFTGLPATNPALGASPPAQTVTPVDTGVGTVEFFAGEVDDPFFFDIPAFSSFIASVRNGAPNASVFSRARDTFAGYDVLAIALRIPVALLRGTNGTVVGTDFLTQRRSQKPTKLGEVKASGQFKTVDREGNPAVNVVLIPFNEKNLYNAGSVRQDAEGRFAGEIVETLTELGTDATHIGILANVAVTYGDLLRLETNAATKPNNGPGGGDNAGSGFPNGRRLKDDTVDTLLFLVTNEALTTGDGVNASDVAPNNTFPFVHESQQPRASGVIDDNTRN